MAVAYFVSCVASSAINGFSWLMTVYMLTSCICGFVYFILDIFKILSPKIMKYHAIFGEIFRVSPVFSATWGVMKLYRGSAQATICKGIPKSILDVACDPNLKSDEGGTKSGDSNGSNDQVNNQSFLGCCPGKIASASFTNCLLIVMCNTL